MAEETRTILSRTTRIRFMATLRDLSSSSDGPKAKVLFAALIALMLLISGLNVLSSYVGRDFMTAVADRNGGEFARQTGRFVLVLGLCTVVAVIYRWTEERLALVTRQFLTRRLVGFYLLKHFYHRLGHAVPNPDQRIADDVKVLTASMLSFLLMTLNATMAILAFSGVMWTISPLLFGVAVVYAAVGSASAIWLGKPLIWLNYDQFDREAEFRAELVQLREHSELVALAHHDNHFRDRLNMRIDRLVTNFRKVIAVNRNLNFFTTGYNYYIQIIPVLVVAPLYMQGKVEFGVITQSTVAFAQLLGAFSLIVTQFQQISSFTAVAARVDAFSGAALEMQTAPPSPIQIVDGDDGLHFDGLTLTEPGSGRVLVQDLSLTIERGMRTLVVGPDDIAKMALFRATAELWDHGRGRIVRPPGGHAICFVPEHPYLPPGTLRDVLAPADCCTETPTDERMRQVLDDLSLSESVARIGGLQVERDWDDVFSLGELQRLSIARVLLIAPEFALLDRIETTLDPERFCDVLGMLDAAGVTYVMIGRSDRERQRYELVVELTGQGPWKLEPRASAGLAAG